MWYSRAMAVENLTLLPKAIPAWYDWGTPPKREHYMVLGVAIAPQTTSIEKYQLSIYDRTMLFVLRSDGKGTWLHLRQLTMQAPMEWPV